MKKSDIQYTDTKNITPQEMIDLYVSVEWGKKEQYSDLQNVQKSIDQTKHLITARNDKGELVGMIRLLDDGWTYAVIADIIVHPDYQRQGIGTALLKKGEEKVPFTVYAPAFAYNEDFFLRNGFNHPNAAMKVFSKRVK